jgi:hypothetical protein
MYNIFREFGVPMKFLRLNKICLTETYSEVHIGEHLSVVFLSKRSKTRRCSNTTAFQLCF